MRREGSRLPETLRAACASLRAAWTYLRAVSGDDAYERYVAHHQIHHAGECLKTRKAFFDERQRQKWSGVSRCC